MRNSLADNSETTCFWYRIPSQSLGRLVCESRNSPLGRLWSGLALEKAKPPDAALHQATIGYGGGGVKEGSNYVVYVVRQIQMIQMIQMMLKVQTVQKVQKVQKARKYRKYKKVQKFKKVQKGKKVFFSR